MTSPNRAVLLRVARALGPLRDELVLVGGQVGELLVTYKQQDDARRRAVMEELASEAQRHGLGY